MTQIREFSDSESSNLSKMYRNIIAPCYHVPVHRIPILISRLCSIINKSIKLSTESQTQSLTLQFPQIS